MSRAGTSQSMYIERATISKQRPELSAQKWADSRQVDNRRCRSLSRPRAEWEEREATHKSECLIV
jgi:hypothetical protein